MPGLSPAAVLGTPPHPTAAEVLFLHRAQAAVWSGHPPCVRRAGSSDGGWGLR